MSIVWIAAPARLQRKSRVPPSSLRRLGLETCPATNLLLPRRSGRNSKWPWFLQAPVPRLHPRSDSLQIRCRNCPSDAAAKSLDANPLDRPWIVLLPWGFSTMPFRVFAPTQICPEPDVLLAIPALVASGLPPMAEKITAPRSAPPFTDCAQLWLLMFCWRFCGLRGRDAQRVFAGRTGSPRRAWSRMPK